MNLIPDALSLTYHNTFLSSPLRDVLSGIIMAATSVPQLIAYAETVGYAGHRGLATAGPPLLVFGLVTGSPYLNGGVTSVTALMTKSDLKAEDYVNEFGEEAYVELVATYSLAVAVASLVLALSGFGTLAKACPKPVQAGFKWGCAIGVLVSALPNGLFASGANELKQLVAGSEDLVELVKQLKGNFPGAVNLIGMLYTLTHPLLWSIYPTILFLGGTYFIMKGSQRVLPKALPPGSDVLLVTALATLYSVYFVYPASTVGDIPVLDADVGIFVGPIRIPVQFLNVKKLVTEVPLVSRFGNSYLQLAISSLVFSAVNFFFVMGTTSIFESEDGIAWSPTRELLAQAASCGMAGLVGSAPQSGSLSRSLVSRMTGTTSQLACLVTAICWIYLQPYMGVMSPTPKAALSAVIVAAVLRGCVQPKDLLNLIGVDALVGWITGVATCVSNPTTGFGTGLVVYYALRFLVPGGDKRKGE
jgi:SulP family sulfate permease